MTGWLKWYVLGCRSWAGEHRLKQKSLLHSAGSKTSDVSKLSERWMKSPPKWICETASRETKSLALIQQVQEYVFNLKHGNSPLRNASSYWTRFKNVYVHPLPALVVRQGILIPARPLVACQYSFAKRYLLFRPISVIFQQGQQNTAGAELWEKCAKCLCSIALCRVHIKSTTKMWLDALFWTVKWDGPRD